MRALVERQRLARGAPPWRAPWPAWIEDALYRARDDALTAAMWRAAQETLRAPCEGDEDDLAAIVDAVRDDVVRIVRSGSELSSLALGRSPFDPAVALWRLGVGVQAVTMKTVALVLPCAR